jgi:hypothetical protein
MQCILRNIVFNVRQQIFVCRDSDSGRSVLPLNLESAARVHVGECGDWSFLSFDPAIASDAGQMASDNQGDTPSKQNNQDLSHLKYVFSVMMPRRWILDSTFY